MRQGDEFIVVGTDTILRNDVAQEIDSRGSDQVLFGERFNLWGHDPIEGHLESLRD